MPHSDECGNSYRTGNKHSLSPYPCITLNPDIWQYELLRCSAICEISSIMTAMKYALHDYSRALITDLEGIIIH